MTDPTLPSWLQGTGLGHIMTGTGLMAVFAMVAAGWSRLKSFGSYVISALVVQTYVGNYNLAFEVGKHVKGHYKTTPTGLHRITMKRLTIDNKPMTSMVPFSMPTSSGLWYGKRGWFYINAKNGMEIMSLRWTADPQGLVIDALNEMEERMARELDSADAGNFRIIPVMGSVGEAASEMWDSGPRRVRRGVGSDTEAKPASAPDQALGESSESWDDPVVGIDKSFMYEEHRYMRDARKRDPLRGLFYPDDALAMLESLRQWYRQRDWYQAHSIPWRTGVMMWGPGGTGKSSMARVAAEMLGLPLYQYYLNTFNDRDFVRKWSEMDTPCVVALEDFDTVFHGRAPATEHKSLSFECVLNQISGISSLNGVCLIVTTNHIDKIDDAMGRIDKNGKPTRPGRIDHILHMGFTTQKQRQQIADYTLGDLVPEEIAELVASNEDTTAAQFQSLCIQRAIEHMANMRSCTAAADKEESNVIEARFGT